ncbi:MAG: hypothetical protein SFV17_09450 [Candidatus Obscuribacter sp.]|nr:hypothetical protein [Candidatus Obscuribacter sp.]
MKTWIRVFLMSQVALAATCLNVLRGGYLENTLVVTLATLVFSAAAGCTLWLRMQFLVRRSLGALSTMLIGADNLKFLPIYLKHDRRVTAWMGLQVFWETMLLTLICCGLWNLELVAGAPSGIAIGIALATWCICLGESLQRLYSAARVQRTH